MKEQHKKKVKEMLFDRNTDIHETDSEEDEIERLLKTEEPLSKFLKDMTFFQSVVGGLFIFLIICFALVNNSWVCRLTLIPTRILIFSTFSSDLYKWKKPLVLK